MILAHSNQDSEIDPYNYNALQKELKEIGYTLSYFQKTTSTMDIVELYAQKKTIKNIVVLTDHQSHGIGRTGRIWYDNCGCSIMFGLLFFIREANIALLADLVALKVCEGIRKAIKSEEIRIKYPNDITVNDKKLGGIIVKNIYDKHLHYRGTNVGIGVNVHYTKDELKKFPTDYPATSLDVYTKSFVKRQNVLTEIIGELRHLDTETDVASLNTASFSLFEKKWRSISSLMGRKIAMLKQDKLIEEGEVINIGLGKGIQLQTSKGKLWFSLFETDMKMRILS
jgi:biotin-[acetyl-CoA-carboxylase] ligase BirA-like protein